MQPTDSNENQNAPANAENAPANATKDDCALCDLVWGKTLYECYLQYFGGPFPVRWEDLDKLSRVNWDKAARRFQVKIFDALEDLVINANPATT